MRTFLLALALASTCVAADRTPEHFNIPLWEDGKVPLAAGNGPLDKPFLTVFLPPAGKRNGSSVVVAPGGSNIMLMYGVEGIEIAERYNDWGAAAFVLTYRMSPRYNYEARSLDGKRAIQVVRARAKEWGLDPNKIGMAGFSAGSEITRATAQSSGPGDPNSADPIERVSSRPDYIVLVYSAGRASKEEQLKNFPPTFMISAAWDRGPANALAQLFVDMNKAGAVAELHLSQQGRHGFGAATKSPEFSPWMDALKHFLTVGGLM